MNAARSRFARRAALVLAATVAGSAVVASALVALWQSAGFDSASSPVIAVVTVAALLLAVGTPAIWNWVGLIRIARLKPGALVVLARREPTLVADLPMYLHRRDLSVDVSDKWVPAVIDERGMAAWTGGVRPRELFVMPWSELGEVKAESFRSLKGQERFGITVDVRPFPTPLLVRVGYSAFGLQAAFDRAGTLAVNEAVGSLRGVREYS